MSVLDDLEAAVLGASQFTSLWRREGRIEEKELGAWIGRPDPDALASVEHQHREAFDRPLDPMLRRFYERFNGLAIAERWDDAPETPTSAGDHTDLDQIGEPTIWPIGRYADHFLFADVQSSWFVFGEIPDSGFFLLVVDGTSEPAPVYWQDVESHLVEAFKVADHFDDFLRQWTAAGLCAPLLLQAAGVPGWGE